MGVNNFKDHVHDEIIENFPTNKVNENGKRVHGKDLNWILIETFPNVEEYKKSDIFKELKSKLTLQRSRDPDYADIEG